MKSRLIRFLFPALLLALPLGAAAGSQAQPQFVYIPKGEVINGNLYRAGETVQVDGTVNGDVIVAGGVVKITGTVAGDVIAVGGRVYVTGPVQGNVRVAGGDVVLDGVVGKNVTVAGGTVVFGSNASIGFEALAMGGTVDMDGRVAKDARVAAGVFTLAGTVGQDAWISAGERLVLHPTAVVDGNLNYSSSRAAEVLSGATIRGAVDYKQLATKHESRSPLSVVAWIAIVIALKIAAIFLLGLGLLWLAPKKLEKISQELTSNFAPMLGWGFVTAIAVPVAALILGLTVIGLPISIILMALYVAGMILSSALAAFWLGDTVLRRATNRHWRGVNEKWALLLGSVLLVVVGAIPVVGWIATCVVTMAAFGALVAFDKRELKKWR
jgi:cytoskeletal protein CcmA (bactofilin family)